jgi:hypothetical protein
MQVDFMSNLIKSTGILSFVFFANVINLQQITADTHFFSAMEGI